MPERACIGIAGNAAAGTVKFVVYRIESEIRTSSIAPRRPASANGPSFPSTNGALEFSIPPMDRFEDTTSTPSR
jgi:hypothetical protein